MWPVSKARAVDRTRTATDRDRLSSSPYLADAVSVNGQGEREGERGEGAFGLSSLCEYMRSKAGSYVVTYFAASTGTEPSVGADLNHLPSSSSSSFPFPFLSLSPLKRTSQRAGSVPYPDADAGHAPRPEHARTRAH